MRCGKLSGRGVLPGGLTQRPLTGVSARSPPRATQNTCELEVLPVRGESPEDEPSGATMRSRYGGRRGWGAGVGCQGGHVALSPQ